MAPLALSDGCAVSSRISKGELLSATSGHHKDLNCSRFFLASSPSAHLVPTDPGTQELLIIVLQR